MPAVLYGALRLLCPDSENDREIFLIDQSIALAVALAGLSIGSLFFIIFSLSVIPYDFYKVAIAQIALAFTFMLMSTLAAAALLRASMSAYIKARASSPGTLAALTLLIALAGPIFGLLLNATTPFPADFQSPAIYIAAVVNGLVLLLPISPGRFSTASSGLRSASCFRSRRIFSLFSSPLFWWLHSHLWLWAWAC